jgi:putative transposase
MANTYTQTYIHFVFAVKFRLGLIQKSWRTDLYKYITGIITNNGHKLISIGGMDDHLHILIGISTIQSLSEIVSDIKRSSSLWINDNKFLPGNFAWQEGYGAFSYGKSQLGDVIKYIANQELHHKKRTFQDEYSEFLKLYDIEFDERYVFKKPE